MDIDIKQLLNDLHKDVVTVVFEKTDGTKRVMKCTLNENHIPPQPETTKTGRSKKRNADVLAVWDVEKQGWRSFRKDRILEVKK